MTPHRVRTALPALALVAATLAACSAGAASSTQPSQAPTTRPTPTPIAPLVTTPTEAAARVIATDPRFDGITAQDPNSIGASRWWVATPLPGGGYEIELTIGWGDCPAGCTERHLWTFEVSPEGEVELVGEEGDEVPVDLPA